MTRNEREKLCALSVKAYGTRFGWKKAVEKGTWIGGADEDGTPINMFVQPTLENVEELMNRQIDRMNLLIQKALEETNNIDNKIEDTNGKEEVPGHTDEV